MTFEHLESRSLFSVVVTNPIADVSAGSGAYPTTIDLNSRFDSTTINGTVVRFAVTANGASGNIDFELFDSTNPITTANFLKYVDSGRYDATFFHRSVDDFVVQGGGYNFPSGSAIEKFGTVQNEFATSPRDSSGKVNTRGTVAMAKKGNDPNSADSEFFINVADNSSNLDNQNGGFTTFARVIGAGMTFVDQINALPTVALQSPFDELPVATTYTSGNTLNQSDVVYVSSAVRISPVTFSVSSTDLTLVNPVIGDDGKLRLNYQPQATGSATITITATDLDGASTTTTFQVAVSPAATPSLSYNNANLDPAGASTVDFGAISAKPGQSVTRTLFIENTGTQELTNLSYSLPQGFSLGSPGPTTLESGERVALTLNLDTSTVRDLSGTFVVTADNSSVASVNIPLAADLHLPVVLGQDGVKSVTFTQGSGATATTATFTLTGVGTATFDFNGTGLAATTQAGGKVVVADAGGGGASLVNITLAGTTIATSIKASSKGASPVIIHGVTGAGTAALNTFDAKTAQLDGKFVIGSSTSTDAQVKKITLSSAVDSEINLGVTGDAAAALALSIGTATNTNLLVGYNIASVAANAWDRGSGTGTIQGGNLAKLAVKGNFSGNLSLTGVLSQATVGGTLNDSIWAVTNGVSKLAAGSANTGFQLTTSQLVGSAAFKGDFSGAINAGAVNAFSATTGTGTTLTASRYLNSVTFKGAVSGGFISSSYSIGKFSALAIDQTRIYAGVNLSSSAILPAVITDFAQPATLDGQQYSSAIGSVTLKGAPGGYAFSTSVISAKLIGSIKMGVVKTLSGGDGIAADFIGSISGRTDANQSLNGSRLDTQSQVPALVASDGTSASQFKLILL